MRRQRQPPHRARRQDGRHADRRDQEPEQLPVGRAGHRLRGRAAVSTSGRRTARRSRTPPSRPAAGATPRASPSPSARRRRPPTTAISPSPTSSPSSSTRPGSPGSGRRSASCPPSAAGGSRPSTASRATTPTSWSSRGRTSPTITTPSPGPPAAYKLASNWVQQDILRIVKERKIPIGEFPVGPEALADLINRVGRSELNTNQGREVLGKMIETGEPVDAIIEAGGYRMVSDRDAIAAPSRPPSPPTPRRSTTSRGARRSPRPSRASSAARS